MKLIKTINTAVIEQLAEDAVGAGGVAGGMAMPLFSRLVQRTRPQQDTDEFEEEEVQPEVKAPVAKYKSLKEHINLLETEGSTASVATDQTFDTTGIIAKLKSLENRETQDQRDTVTFGLEDDDGGLVRVMVKHEQAEDFEKALQAMMADVEEDEDRPEIAELLFKLKDRFDLVDVQWPPVEEDEEEDVALQGDPAGGEEGLPDDGSMGDEALDGDIDAGAGGDTASVETLLTQVIDMMKADAEARTADARAREAEAKNREAEAIAAQASTRVKQEEQLLDMDTYNKSKKEQERESKRLAQLAKWKHEVGGDSDPNEDDFNASASRVSLSAPTEENEERVMRRPAPMKTPAANRMRGKVHPHDIASFIINRAK